MTDQTVPLEIIETIEIDENLPPEPEAPKASYHTLLEVWRAVLAPARNGMQDQPISPQWATRMVQNYPQIAFHDTPGINTLFFHIVGELAQILDDEIATDDQCLKWSAAEEDVANNSGHYKELLISWQSHMLRRELEWDARDPDAPVMLAALSEVHNMFFGDKGLVGHLDSIKFQYTEADQQVLTNVLAEVREAFYGEAGEDGA